MQNSKQFRELQTISLLIAMIVIASLAFSGCATTPTPAEDSPQGIAVGEPNPSTPKTETAPTNTTPTTPTDTKEPVSASSTSTSAYKDGTYTSVGSYTAPSGTEKIGVTLTVKDGNVTAASLDKMGVHPVSQKMQTNFESGYKAVVIGKSLASLSLGPVSGSSLTPKGFNAAVSQIKTQAQS